MNTPWPPQPDKPTAAGVAVNQHETLVDTNVQAALEHLAVPGGVAVGTTYSDPLAADVTGSDPTFMTVKSGVFVARSTSVDVEIQLGVAVFGNSQVVFDFLSGIVSLEVPKSLRQSGTLSPAAAGVTTKHIGKCWQNTTAIIKYTAHLTGLTLGGRYTWAVQAAVVSGSEDILPPGGFADAGRIVAQTDVPLTRAPKMYVTFYNDNKVLVYTMGGRPFYPLLDRKALHVLAANITVGAVPVAIAMTPDQSTVVAGNLTDKTLSIIDTTTDTVTLTTAALTGAPNDIQPDAGNTVVWVGCADGHLRSVNVSTGAVVANWTVSAQPITRFVTDGTNAYCAVSNDTKVYKVVLSSGTTTSVTTAKPPNSIALIPGNTQVWVGTTTSGGSSSLINIQTSNLAVLQTISTAANTNVQTVRVSASGRILWAGQANNFASYYTINSPDDPTNNKYDSGNQGAPINDIYVTADHYIYAARASTKNDVLLFPSATWYCRALGSATPSAGVGGEFCEVRFLGATQG